MIAYLTIKNALQKFRFFLKKIITFVKESILYIYISCKNQINPIRKKVKEIVNLLKVMLLSFYKNSKFEKHLKKKIICSLFWLLKTKRYFLFSKIFNFFLPFLKSDFINNLQNKFFIIFMAIVFAIILVLIFL